MGKIKKDNEYILTGSNIATLVSAIPKPTKLGRALKRKEFVPVATIFLPFREGPLERVILLGKINRKSKEQTQPSQSLFILQPDLASKGAPVAQWAKHWPTYLSVPGSSPARGKVFSTVNVAPLHTAVVLI